MTDALKNHQGTVSIGGRAIANLTFAEDIDGLAGKEEELASQVVAWIRSPQPFAWKLLQGRQN